MPDTYGIYKSKVNMINQSYVFQSAISTNNKSVEMDFDKEIQGADVIVNVQDYVVFPTMVELIKEVVPSLFHRIERSKNIIKVILPEKLAVVATGDPVYIIDGIATSNSEYFLSILPADVIQIKIINNEKKLHRFWSHGKEWNRNRPNKRG